MSDWTRAYDSEEPENPKDPKYLADKWSKEIEASKKWMQNFHQAGVNVEREYLARPSDTRTADKSAARYNIFWANVQVQIAAMYTKLPVPEVDRTHFDQNDDVARVAALILERIFTLELKNLDESPFDVYKLAIQDRLVPGMGVVWPRYEFKESTQKMPAIMSEDGKKEMAPAYDKTIVTDEAVPLDYVRWDDFFYSPCRTWTDRRWQARRVYMSKQKCLARFGKIISAQLSYKAPTGAKSSDDPLKQSPEPVAEVFEIWDKDTLCVSWYSPGCPVICDYKDDPLHLSGFFPAKKPLMATHVTSAFLPRPDYAMAQDQYAELNIIASRTRLLTEALKVVGVYDKTADGVKRMLGQAAMNELIPVDNWAMFAEKGGIKGVVDWLPLEQIAKTLEYLTKRKAALLQEIYEIYGLSDIMRGQSVASETATAQQLKAQYGSARMQNQQNQVAEFITEATRARAEIICRHWQPQTIRERSQIDATPDKQYADAAIQLLKSNTQMALRLTVHADTIAAPDWNQEKQLRVDFLQAISQFIGMSMPLIEEVPGSAPFLIQMLQWAAAGFKGGKQIEGVLDQALMSLQKGQGQTEPKSGREAKAEAEGLRAEAEAAKKDAAAAQKSAGEQQAAFKREQDLRNQLVRQHVDHVVDNAIKEVKHMLETFACKAEAAATTAKAEGKEAAAPGKVPDGLLEKMVGILESLRPPQEGEEPHPLSGAVDGAIEQVRGMAGGQEPLPPIPAPVPAPASAVPQTPPGPSPDMMAMMGMHREMMQGMMNIAQSLKEGRNGSAVKKDIIITMPDGQKAVAEVIPS